MKMGIQTMEMEGIHNTHGTYSTDLIYTQKSTQRKFNFQWFVLKYAGQEFLFVCFGGDLGNWTRRVPLREKKTKPILPKCFKAF